MTRTPTSIERFADALLALVESDRTLDRTASTLWSQITSKVREAQANDAMAARAVGKRLKPGDPIPWMGIGERAHDAYFSVLHSEELQLCLLQRGYRLSVAPTGSGDVQVQIVSVVDESIS